MKPRVKLLIESFRARNQWLSTPGCEDIRELAAKDLRRAKNLSGRKNEVRAQIQLLQYRQHLASLGEKVKQKVKELT